MYKKAALIASGVVVLVLAIFIYRFDDKLDQMEINTDKAIIQEDQSPEPAFEPITAAEEEQPEDFYVLMIGLDQRGSSLMLNTDSLIVAHIVPQHQIVKLLSIPRDQKVENSQGRSVKINSIFAEGYNHAISEAKKDPSLLSGRKVSIGKKKISEEYISSGMVALRETFEKFLGIPIENTFLVNFETVVELVDKVGGIEIYVDRSMQYDAEFDGTHIHLEKGLQTLQGQDALNFSRFREDNRGLDFFSSDFDRGRRQQEVITALVKKMASWGNIGKAMELLDIVTSNVKTDMKRGRMVPLIKDFYGNLSSETVISIPYNAYWESPYVLIDKEDLEETLNLFTSIEKPTELSKVDSAG